MGSFAFLPKPGTLLSSLGRGTSFLMSFPPENPLLCKTCLPEWGGMGVAVNPPVKQTCFWAFFDILLPLSLPCRFPGDRPLQILQFSLSIQLPRAKQITGNCLQEACKRQKGFSFVFLGRGLAREYPRTRDHTRARAPAHFPSA